MSLFDKLVEKAQTVSSTIVLPEGQDPRVMKAAKGIAEKKIAEVVVLATPEECETSMEGVSFDGLNVTIVNWLESPDASRYASILLERRKAKGMTEEQAAETVKNRLYFGNLMVKENDAQGMVAGSIASTPDMLRASFHCLGTAPGIKIASSCFVMELASPSPAGDDVLIYSDCGVNPEPTAEQLVDIAISSAQSRKALVGDRPRLAFLSFATKGSADHPLVDKVHQAAEMTAKRIADEGLEIDSDGELQADAALVPSVGASKAPGSNVAGKANVLIFPDLQAGNICYKITERLAGAKAYGPILQGVAKPVNDLSRGCSAEDIVGVAAITACQAISASE